MTNPNFTTEASRWAAVSGRNPDAEGCFVYCVKTTKIFCRPNCPSRLARRSNIEYFNNAIQAEAAGYRACKRCQPNLDDFVPNAEKTMRKITLALDRLPPEAPIPSLDMLAREAGMTKYHFHRSFRKMTGYTPRDYALLKQREQRVASGPVADVLHTPTTPSLANDLFSSLGTTDSPASGLGPFNSSPLWNSFDWDSLMAYDSFGWQDLQPSELDYCLYGYTEKYMLS